MACGDTQNSWVPTLLGSAWSGSMDSTTPVTLALVSANNAATMVVNITPTVGVWSYNSSTVRLTLSVSLEGYGWDFVFGPDACGLTGDVTQITATGYDSTMVAHVVTLTRIL